MTSKIHDALRDAPGGGAAETRKAAEADAALRRIVGGLYALMLPAGWLSLRVAAKTGALG